MLLTLLLDPIYHYGEQYELHAADTAIAVILLVVPPMLAGLLLWWALGKLRQSVPQASLWAWLALVVAMLILASYLYWLFIIITYD
jgi:hypothetical protein